MSTGRKALVRELVEFRRPLAQVLAELRPFGWDCEAPLFEVRTGHVRCMLEAFIDGEVSADQVEEWANAIEVRDDLEFATSEVRQTVHALANPVLEGHLDPTRASELLASAE